MRGIKEGSGPVDSRKIEAPSELPAVEELSPREAMKLEARKRQLYGMIDSGVRGGDLDVEIAQLQRDFPPCPHLLNIVLKARIRTEDTEGIRRVMEEFGQRGLRPNRFTYSLLINYYRLIGRMDCAESLLARMLERELPVDPSHFTTMVIGWSRKGNLERAKYWFERLRQSDSTLESGFGKNVDQMAIHALCHGHIFHGDLNDARSLLQQAKAAGFQPTRVTAKLELFLRLKEGAADDAMEMYRLIFLPASGALPPPEWLEIATAFATHGHPTYAHEVALDVFRLFRFWRVDRLRTILKHTTDPEQWANFESAMRSMANAEEWKAIQGVFKRSLKQQQME